MFCIQSRIFARTVDDAIDIIFAKHGNGKLSIREVNVQPRQGLVWYEYYLLKDKPLVPQEKP